MKQRFEHCVVHVTHAFYFEGTIQREMDEYSNDGWELVSVVAERCIEPDGADDYHLFFKRPVAVEGDDRE